jgi:hypothetical protein
VAKARSEFESDCGIRSKCELSVVARFESDDPKWCRARRPRKANYHAEWFNVRRRGIITAGMSSSGGNCPFYDGLIAFPGLS